MYPMGCSSSVIGTSREPSWGTAQPPTKPRMWFGYFKTIHHHWMNILMWSIDVECKWLCCRWSPMDLGILLADLVVEKTREMSPRFGSFRKCSTILSGVYREINSCIFTETCLVVPMFYFPMYWEQESQVTSSDYFFFRRVGSTTKQIPFQLPPDFTDCSCRWTSRRSSWRCRWELFCMWVSLPRGYGCFRK